MASTKPSSDVGFRKTWDDAEYLQKARERQDEEEGRGPSSQMQARPRGNLERQDVDRDVNARIGKTFLVTKDTHSSQSGGFYCVVCACQLRDSITYLDHINGKNHQRMLGMSMEVEKKTVEDVIRAIARLKQQKEQAQEYDYKARVLDAQRQEAEAKAAKREARKAARRRPHDNNDDDDTVPPEMAAMGFTGFSSSKR